MSQSLHDKLRYAQGLLSHQVPPGDVAEVLERALDLLIRQAETRKFAATDKPRPGRRDATAGGRYVPDRVKRAVWKRDGGQCTFVSETGQRCPACGTQRKVARTRAKAAEQVNSAAAAQGNSRPLIAAG